jgi:hypothetical protein
MPVLLLDHVKKATDKQRMKSFPTVLDIVGASQNINMSFDRVSLASLALLIAVSAPAHTPSSDRVAEVANISFYSNELLNLHHTLYAAAWAGRTKVDGRVLAQKLPHPLTAPFSPKERAIWEEAVRYYDSQIADRDPLSGRGMERIKEALVSSKLDDPAIEKELMATLEAARPVFHKYFWPEQDRVNRAWIAAMTERVKAIAPDVVPRLEKTYDAKWFSTPVRADAVWVGHWGQAYTSLNPPHSVLSSTDPFDQDWSGAEMVFHEFSHALNFKLQGKLRTALGDSIRQHGNLWHATQFYLTGEVVRDVLAARKIDYTPLVYSLGLFDTQWAQYRNLIEGVWAPYLRGRDSMDTAVAGTAIVLAPPVAEVANLRFYSDEWLNLHHTLYAAAWAARKQGASLAGKLPHPLTAPFTPEERLVWEQAVQYYDSHIASRDLFSGPGMVGIKLALVSGNLNDPAIDKDLRAALEAVRPVFEKYFWAEEDRVNRAWITSVTERVKTTAPAVIPRLEKIYEAKWFSYPLRADVVWVGNWAGSFTTDDLTHSTLSSTDPVDQDWSGVEAVFHEFSHVLADTLTARVNETLGEAARQNGTLWHAIQFYLTGETVREVLVTRNVDYEPMVYSANLFAGVWRAYRKPIEEAWQPYLQGSYSMAEAIARTTRAVAPPK